MTTETVTQEVVMLTSVEVEEVEQTLWTSVAVE